MIHLLRAGLLTTVQDLGRPGFRHLGVAVGGAMDRRSLRTANALIGNPEDAAALEITLGGATFSFQTDTLVALTGAPVTATTQAGPVPADRPVWLQAGSVLSLGRPTSGCRVYLGVAGGIAVPVVLGGRGTALKGRFGGFAGRALSPGDTLTPGAPSPQAQRISWALSRSRRPVSSVPWFVASRARAGEVIIRAMPGPEYARFTPATRELFWSQPYRVSAQADRMGSRLAGSPVTLSEPYELLSSAVAQGTVQIPPDGQPIILNADAQTTGGYPRIGQVAQVDLDAVGQLMPGSDLRFTRITLAEARALHIRREQEFQILQAALQAWWAFASAVNPAPPLIRPEAPPRGPAPSSPRFSPERYR